MFIPTLMAIGYVSCGCWISALLGHVLGTRWESWGVFSETVSLGTLWTGLMNVHLWASFRSSWPKVKKHCINTAGVDCLLGLIFPCHQSLKPVKRRGFNYKWQLYTVFLLVFWAPTYFQLFPMKRECMWQQKALQPKFFVCFFSEHFAFFLL